MIEVKDAAALEGAHADVRRLYDYWRARRGARPFPSRDDIDPVSFGFALGRVSLVEVLENPRRFRYRLVSTTLTKNLGYEMTGKFLDEMPDKEVRAYVAGLYEAAVTQRMPLYDKGRRVLDRREWIHEMLVLPLSSDGVAIDMLMVFRATARPRPQQ